MDWFDLLAVQRTLKNILQHYSSKTSILQRIFLTQKLNLGFLHCSQILYQLSYQETSSNKYLGLISFRIDWFDLLAVRGTLKSLLHCTIQKH